MADALTTFSTTRADRFALAPEEENWQRTSFGTLPGEDPSFDQLYSLQRIELTKKLRKNHGRDEKLAALIRLKMAGLVLAKKSSSGGRYAIILPTGVNVTTAKEFDPSAAESAFCSHRLSPY